VDVLPAIHEVEPDLVVLDLQIGNMGGMAACMEIRHDETAERIPITAVLMLLDRAADVFLARRCDADGWLIKPLDAFRLRKAAATLLDGYSFFEGVDPDTDLATAVGVIKA
nr:response regulator transcription factor [Burkholderiaceae bacterium]